MLVVKIVLLLFLWHTAESNQGMSITCSTSHVEMLHPRKGIQLGNKPERKETKLVGVWNCGKQKKGRDGTGRNGTARVSSSNLSFHSLCRPTLMRSFMRS